MTNSTSDALLDGVPNATGLSQRAQRRVLRAYTGLRRFTADDADRCPEGLRPGYTVPERVALSERSRGIYLRAVLVARERRVSHR